MTRKSKYWLFVPIIFGVALSACASASYKHHPDSEHPDAEVAIVDGSLNIFPFLIIIGAGTSVGINRIDGEHITKRTARLRPGRHRLEFWQVTSLYALLNTATIVDNYCLFDQDFQAGHHYKIQANTLERQSPETATSKIYSATVNLKIFSPNADTLVTTPVICMTGQGYYGIHFCKTDRECKYVIKPPWFSLFSEITQVPGRCAPQAGYEYGICEATQP